MPPQHKRGSTNRLLQMGNLKAPVCNRSLRPRRLRQCGKPPAYMRYPCGRAECSRGTKTWVSLPLGKTSARVSCVTCFFQHAFFPQALSLFSTFPGENRVESACNYCPLRCLGNMPVSWAEQPLFLLRFPLTVLLSASHALRLQIGIRTPENIIVRHIPTIPLVMIARLTGGSNEPSPQTRLPPQSPQFCKDSEWTRQ